MVGLLVGSLMCFSNMYFGLQTGWISMMSLQASLLGFVIFKPFRHLDPAFGPKENVYLQTVAVATATMPLAAGFVGIIPALTQLTTADHPAGPLVLPAWKLMLWSLGLSFIGVFFAVPLRKQAIIKEKLKFPSGTATAQMIHVLHDKKQEQTLQGRRTSGSLQDDDSNLLGDERVELSMLNTLLIPSSHLNDDDNDNRSTYDNSLADENSMWALKAYALMVSFMISSLYTLASYFFPVIYALPLFNWMTLNFIDFKAWEWYFTPSLSYVGQGIIMVRQQLKNAGDEF
jgi:OPT family oligopeptide transporter